MRNWICLVLVTIVLIGLTVFQRVQISRIEERYRMLIERQDAVEQLSERFPVMMQMALERHRLAMVAYLESRDD